MSFTRVKSAPGWGYNEELTSAQINQLDINVSNAVDGRGGSYENPEPIIFTGPVVLHNLQAICPALFRSFGVSAWPNVRRPSNTPQTLTLAEPINVILADQIDAGYFWTLSKTKASHGNIVFISRATNSGAFGLHIMSDDPVPVELALIGQTAWAVLVYYVNDDTPENAWKLIMKGVF